MHEQSPVEARVGGAIVTQLIGPGPDVRRSEEHRLTTADGDDFRIRVLVPDAAARSVVAYFHGGGWVVGDIDGFDTLGRILANDTHSVVVLVEYRKAPESRYPAAVEDAWQALQWVDEHVSEIAGRPVPLIVAGDSAGGNLATVVARRARDAGGPAVSQQVLVYPVTDADLDSSTYLDPENQLMLDRHGMIWFWDHYIDVSRRGEPDASPLRADLAGLPPAVVLTAEHDVLRGEGEAYAEALHAAGVPVSSRRFEGQMHGFFSMVNILPGSAEALKYVAEAISTHLDTLDDKGSR
ncbi:MAG: alpha/beta hydrolase [Aeromicrobium sp.]